jgi:hypothetical protein
MNRRAAILLAALLGLACVAFAGPASDVVLTAKLTGKYLHASPTGSGMAKVTLESSQVCWQLTWKGIGAVQESGIHKTPPPPAGRREHSVLPFKAITTHTGRVSAPAAVIEAIAVNPGSYYADIHSTKYPKGAIGGRLRPA